MPTETEGTHTIGKVSLYSKTWTPDTPPVAKLIFVHGFNDHCGRYYELFPTLASRGITVYAFDQRGWGKSVRSDADKGKTGPTSLVISDVASFIKAQLPSPIPVFVAGHSMGGGEVITLASDPTYKDLMGSIRGWILESPFIGFAKGSEPGALTTFFGRLAGKALPNMKLKQPPPPENCTRDPAVVADLKADTLLHGEGTLEGLASMLDRTAALNTGKAKLNPGVQAIFLGHGTADKATSYEISQKWFNEQSSVEDKTFKSYEGWSHQLHADSPGNRNVWATDVADWILARCDSKHGDGSKL